MKLISLLKRHKIKTNTLSKQEYFYSLEFSALEATKYLISNERSELAQLLQSIIKDSSVADIGCGTGNYSKYFAPDKYLGLDYSKELLNVAGERNLHYEYQQIELLEGVIPYGFDYYLVMSVIEHLPNFRSSLEIVRKIGKLAQKGTIIVWHKPPRRSQFYFTREILRSENGKMFYQNNNPYWIWKLCFTFGAYKTKEHEVWVLKKRPSSLKNLN